MPLVLPRVVTVLFVERHRRAGNLNHRAVNYRRNHWEFFEQLVFNSTVLRTITSLNAMIACSRFLVMDDGSVSVGRHTFFNASVPSFKKDDEEEELVLVGVDKALPSASLKGDRVDEVEDGLEKAC